MMTQPQTSVKCELRSMSAHSSKKERLLLGTLTISVAPTAAECEKLDDSLAVYVYTDYNPSDYVASSEAYSSSDKVFSLSLGENYIFQVVVSSSSNNSVSSFDISTVSYESTYYYLDNDGGLSSGAIAGIAIGGLLAIIALLLLVRSLAKVSLFFHFLILSWCLEAI
jgi:tetrahydromethanopterin S-methyltransferase subunit F